MKRGIKYPVGQITRLPEKEGISIEEQMRKALHSKEPIQATAKIEYTERGDGVLPQFDIRTDRFELALLATDRIHASAYAQRMTTDGYQQNEDGAWMKIQQETGGEA